MTCLLARSNTNTYIKFLKTQMYACLQLYWIRRKNCWRDFSHNVLAVHKQHIFHSCSKQTWTNKKNTNQHKPYVLGSACIEKWAKWRHFFYNEKCIKLNGLCEKYCTTQYEFSIILATIFLRRRWGTFSLECQGQISQFLQRKKSCRQKQCEFMYK